MGFGEQEKKGIYCQVMRGIGDHEKTFHLGRTEKQVK